MKFNKLDVPNQWKDYFTKYPHGYTIFEALCTWTNQVDNMVDNQNNWIKYLDNFVEHFEFELQVEVKETLERWQNEGRLDDIINEALQTQMDVLELQLTETMQKTESVVSIKKFGAKGDGITDDTQAIQDVIDFVLEYNYKPVIVVPYGKFIISSPLIAEKSIRIIGEGDRAFRQSHDCVLHYTGDDCAFRLARGSSLEGIILEGEQIDGTTAIKPLIGETNLADIQMDKVMFRLFDVNFINSGWGNTFNDCVFRSSKSKNIVVDAIGGHIVFNNCLFFGEGYSPHINIEIIDGDGIRFNSCWIEKNSIAMSFRGAAKTTINGSYFEATNLRFFDLSNADKDNHLIIRDTFMYAGGAGASSSNRAIFDRIMGYVEIEGTYISAYNDEGDMGLRWFARAGTDNGLLKLGTNFIRTYESVVNGKLFITDTASRTRSVKTNEKIVFSHTIRPTGEEEIIYIPKMHTDLFNENRKQQYIITSFQVTNIGELKDESGNKLTGSYPQIMMGYIDPISGSTSHGYYLSSMVLSADSGVTFVPETVTDFKPYQDWNVRFNDNHQPYIRLFRNQYASGGEIYIQMTISVCEWLE